MENFKNYAKLLLGVAVLGTAALTQSFTERLTPPSGDHVLVDGTWRPKTDYPNGDCLDATTICSYNKIGSAPGPMNDQFKNPANFETADYGRFETND